MTNFDPSAVSAFLQALNSEPVRTVPTPSQLLNILGAAIDATLDQHMPFTAQSVILAAQDANPTVEIGGREVRNIVRNTLAVAAGKYAMSRGIVNGEDTDIYTPIAR